MRVVSWNVGRVYTSSGNNRLADEDIPRVAQTLAELAPDVVLLQEVASATQLTRLTQRLGGYEGGDHAPIVVDVIP